LALQVLIVGGALAVIVAGFLGLDRWFYERVSLVLETKDRLGDRDFYTLTKPFWLVCRYAFGYGVAGLAGYVALLAWNPRTWRTPTAGLLAVLITALAANAAQGAIGRLRPNQAPSHLAFTQPFAELLTKQRVSFPSGEAATALALAYVLARLYPRWKAASYVAGALAAVARLVNGAHYLSDVVAGGLLGALLARLLFRFFADTVLRVARHER
jgi:membrane-associated phospholipid phosphatase